jgi:hypothetical protein
MQLNRFCLAKAQTLIVSTDDGLVGWGAGFGYHCSEAVPAMVRRSVAPILLRPQRPRSSDDRRIGAAPDRAATS